MLKILNKLLCVTSTVGLFNEDDIEYTILFRL